MADQSSDYLWVIALVVIFSPEIRISFRASGSSDRILTTVKSVREKMVQAYVKAVAYMSKIGALVAIQEAGNLQNIFPQGIPLDAIFRRIAD